VTLSMAGKTAVVTGASRGIGRAVAAALAGAGARVAGCARNPDAGSDLYRCDVARAADVRRFAADVLGRLGAPDVLVNNAGIVGRGRLDEMPIETWEAVLTQT